MAPTPRGPRLKSDRWIFGGGSAWWIAAGLPDRDATWEFLKHMELPEVGQNLALGGFAPDPLLGAQLAGLAALDQPPKSKRLLVDGLKKLLPFPKLTTWDAFNEAIDAEVQSLWKGERRAREVAERIRAATDPILAEHQRNLKAGREGGPPAAPPRPARPPAGPPDGGGGAGAARRGRGHGGAGAT